MNRIGSLNYVYKCLIILILTGNQKGMFSLKNEQLKNENGQVEKRSKSDFGIHASLMISPYPTSSVLDIPHMLPPRPKRITRPNRKTTRKGRKVVPQFEDVNGTTVIGSPGGRITLNCNIFMLQDYTVSWVHRTIAEHDDDPTDQRSDKKYRLDLLTIGNSTYTSDDRISANFRHPSNWGLTINNLTPDDAGMYLCQLSTFPARALFVFLEIQGKFRHHEILHFGSRFY